jgi:hypothetical protein
MHRFLMRNHAPVVSVSKELKTWLAIGLTLLATAAWADPQSEISAYRKSYGLPAVTADAKLTELARQQANAMAERRSMGHNVYASFHSRIAPYGSASATENLAMGTKTFEETLAMWKSSYGHNANLLNRNVTRMGIDSGCAIRTPAKQGSCTFYFSTNHIDESRHTLK